MTDELEHLKTNQRQLDMDGCEVGVSRQALDELLARVERQEAMIKMLTPKRPPLPLLSLHQHKKRGSFYELIADATFQVDGDLDMEKVKVYVDHAGTWWVRPAYEFNDGRFTTIEIPAASNPALESARYSARRLKLEIQRARNFAFEEAAAMASRREDGQAVWPDGHDIADEIRQMKRDEE